MSIPNNSSDARDFNEWLDHCPLRWRRIEINEDEVTYVFSLPVESD